MEYLINNLLQRVPIQDIDLPDSEQIDATLLLSTLRQLKQNNPYYTKTFLTSKLFKSSNIDQDEFYELFTELLSAKPKPATEKDMVCYKINGQTININETPRLISGQGTTGLRTWEAALYLSVFLNEEYGTEIEGKSVLELGAGTGLVGLSLIKNNIGFKRLIISDGDSNLIEQLSNNFESNGINIHDDNSGSIRCQGLWWGRDAIPEGVDLMIAADVTYDSSVIPDLVKCIHDGLQNGAEHALIAATIRNEDTIGSFEKEVESQGLKWDVVKSVKNPGELVQSVWYPKSSPEIRIYKVTMC